MGYSPCMITNFGHFQNVLIFHILGVFGAVFLHTTTLLVSFLIFDPNCSNPLMSGRTRNRSVGMNLKFIFFPSAQYICIYLYIYFFFFFFFFFLFFLFIYNQKNVSILFTAIDCTVIKLGFLLSMPILLTQQWWLFNLKIETLNLFFI